MCISWCCCSVAPEEYECAGGKVRVEKETGETDLIDTAAIPGRWQKSIKNVNYSRAS